MQVSRQDDSITHAVIGHQESVEMGVSDSSALMHILSSALYTHPKLAVVREIMCNGWDAHIDAGITDKPLAVELSTSQLSIRDFGKGIPHDKIGQIYGVYGNSTKRDDSKSTGGFGLGSKAPFAYVDNFEVVSYHEGVMTVYRVSKSSMEVGGKPSINKIVSVPTTETGIKVTFSIKNGDRDQFENHLEEVRVLGEIHITLNGLAVEPPFPLTNSPTGYIVTQYMGTLTSRVNVRYGNVVYPIPRSAAYQDEYDIVDRGIRNLRGNYNVIFLAPPDAISIAPSREALNLTELTVKTLTGILQKFDVGVIKQAGKAADQIVKTKIKEHIKVNASKEQMYTDIRDIKYLSGVNLRSRLAYSYTVKRAAIQADLSGRDSWRNAIDLIPDRIKRLITKGEVPGKFAKALLRRHAGLKGKHASRKNDYSAVVHKFVTMPIRQMIEKHPKMNQERLFFASVGKYGSCTFYAPKRFDMTSLYNASGFLRKRVLVVRSQTAAEKFFKEIVNYGHEVQTGWVVYQVTTHIPTNELVKEEFAKMGYEVFDQIPAPAMVEVDGVKVPAPRKPSKKRIGYLTLRDSYVAGDQYFLLSRAREVGKPATATHDPVAYVVLSNKQERPMRVSDFSPSESRAINQLWGDKIAVVTSAQAEILALKGTPHVSDFVNTHVDDTLSASQNFRRFLAYGRYWDEYNDQQFKLMRTMLKHDSLMLACGLRFSLTAETELLLTFYNGNHLSNGKMPKCEDLSKKVKKSEKFDLMRKRIEKSPWNQFLNLRTIEEVLTTKQPDSAETEIPYELVRNLLK